MKTTLRGTSHVIHVSPGAGIASVVAVAARLAVSVLRRSRGVGHNYFQKYLRPKLGFVSSFNARMDQSARQRLGWCQIRVGLLQHVGSIRDPIFLDQGSVCQGKAPHFTHFFPLISPLI